MFPTGLTQGAGGAAGGLAAANPYGAAIGAAAGVLDKALTDTPSNTASGSGQFTVGPFVVGTKNVGSGSTSGSTSASQSASQTQPGTEGAAVSAKSNVTLYVIIGAAVLLILGGLSIFAFRRKK